MAENGQKLILNVSEQSMLYLVHCATAQSMWNKFTSVYEGKSAISVHMLQAKWFALTKDSQNDIAKIEDRLVIISSKAKDNERKGIGQHDH